MGPLPKNRLTERQPAISLKKKSGSLISKKSQGYHGLLEEKKTEGLIFTKYLIYIPLTFHWQEASTGLCSGLHLPPEAAQIHSH